MPKKVQKTAEEYIDALPENWRRPISSVRALVKQNLQRGFSEFVTPSMIMYGIPLSRFPNTYNGHPLCFVALAAQKNYCSLYLMSVYGDKGQEAKLRDGFKRAGKKLDMGKSCVHFKTEDDLALDVIGELIAGLTPDRWIEIYKASRKMTRT